MRSILISALSLLAAGPVAAQEARNAPRPQAEGPALSHRPPDAEAPERGAERTREATLRVLALARVEDRRGGFRILDLAGEAGVLVDEMSGAGSVKKAPVYRMWGRMKSKDSVLRLRNLVAEEHGIQFLWLAWAEVPAGAAEPVPLTTLVWSPWLYPNRSSTLTRGPAGARRYYLEPGSAAVLESTNDGKDFETAFSAGRVPEFIEGGAGFDLTKIFWKAKVANWIDKQEELRRKGYQKYGPLLEGDGE